MCDLGINTESFNPRVLFIIRRKFDEKSKVSYHSHDFPSIIYILSGSCTYNIDNKLYQIKKGDLVVCNPGLYHGKILNPGEEITEIHIGLNNLYVETLQKDFILDPECSPMVNLSKYDQEFFKCCTDMLLEQEKDEPGSELILKTLVMKLVILILRATHTGSSTKSVQSFSFESYDKIAIINTIVSFVNENYMNEMSLDKLSKNTYLSPVYISKIFKEELGESPINYLIKVRLSKACELLEKGNLSVKAIAKNVGYNDAYHFSKLFKKYYGIPPTKYKVQTD